MRKKSLSKKLIPVMLCGSIISFTACTSAMMTASAATNGTFTFSNGSVSSTASSGYTLNGNVLTITKSGSYTLTGSGSGNVIVTADNVSLTLNGLSLSSSSSVITANGDTTLSLSGTNNITCTDSNNPAITGSADVTITGNGSVAIVSAEKGIHSDETVTIGDSSDTPKISIDAGDEGIEGNIINLVSGNGTIKAGDDGMNGDTDASDDTSGCLINIAGGTWIINAACDGLDSNGSISISGGYTTVYGSTENNDAALDYDYNCTYTGGTFAAIGTSGMAQTPSSGVYVRFTGTSLSNGDTVVVKDNSGNTVYSTTAVKSANDIVLSQDSITQGSTYSLYVNGSSVSSSSATTGAGSGGQGNPGGQGGFGGQTPPDRPGEQGGQGGQGGQTPPDKPGEQGGQGGQGGNSSSVSYNGATTISSDTTNSNQTYSSTTAEQNALLVSGGTSTITNPTVTKSGSPSGNSDNYDFYGTNAGVLVYNGAALNVKGGTVTTDASYANGIFAYGTGTANVSDTTINTSSNNSGALMVTGGGTLTANNVTATTQGNSSAAIRSDRGGGTLTVNGGNFTTNGTGSPVIYSTAAITVNNANLTATKSEGVVVEGANSVTLNGVTLKDTNNQLNGQSTTYKNIFLYQSQSGDAAEGTSYFTAKDSDITTNKGDTIYVTNTTSVINLTNNTIQNNDSTGAFLRAESAAWGSSGSNGGKVTLNMSNQDVSGDVVIDSVSTLNMSLSNGSDYTGTINGSKTANNIALTLDSGSTITLTGDSYVTSLSNADSTNSNINLNGHKLYVNGTAITASTNVTALSNNSTISSTAITLGNTVTVNAKATGGTGSYTYAVYYRRANTSTWTTAQKYGSNATVSIKPLAATDYDVCVKVKDSNGTEEKKYFTVKVSNTALSNSSTVSSTAITLGNTVTVNAKATGGTGSYTYAVYYKKTSDTKWVEKQSYSSNATVSVKPAHSTTYQICVKVKDSNGTIEKKYFTVKVSKNTALANSSTISATSITLGNTVTVNAKATGGSGYYNYAVYYKKTSDTKWVEKQSYTSNPTVTVKPAHSTTYQICVKVKDSNGTIEKKYFTVSVSK